MLLAQGESLGERLQRPEVRAETPGEHGHKEQGKRGARDDQQRQRELRQSRIVAITSSRSRVAANMAHASPRAST